MKRIARALSLAPVLALSVLVAPAGAQTEPADDTVADVVNSHILPRFQMLADQTQRLAGAAAADCNAKSAALRSAYGDAFDAWISASHLRFGPSEANDRAFALAFWPDSRGATPRALAGLISEQDPIAATGGDYGQVSIAARGFYAMEYVLYDDTLMSASDAPYHCQLVQTISADMATTARHIFEDWQSTYADIMVNPSDAGIYRSDDEVLQEIFKSLSTGLQFTAEARLGRPLGTFARPRPTRAEAWRSGRSARHVMLSLTALRDLALRLAGDDADLAGKLDAGFDRASSQLHALGDPIFAGVARPQTRLKIEVLQQSIEAIRTTVRAELGPKIGVAAGFNALDGD